MCKRLQMLRACGSSADSAGVYIASRLSWDVAKMSWRVRGGVASQ